MKRTAFHQYWIPDERKPGKFHLTRWKMSAETAAKDYPGAKPDERTLEWRDLPETDAERMADTHTGKHMGKQPGVA